MNNTKQTNHPIFLALDSLFRRYINLHKEEHRSWPRAHFDPPWPSPCEIKETKPDEDNVVFWQPVERHTQGIFDDLEKGFEFEFPEELKVFFGSFWSNGICVEYADLPFNLIQIWNEEDETQLKENMLGHVFAKIKNKQAITFFIGCTDGNDIVSLDKDTGAIVVEKPGFKAHRQLAESLEQLLVNIEPSLDNY